MTISLAHPGVYIQELQSGVRPIVGVSTSTTAFVGRARRGPVDEPVVLHSFADYERRFGGLWEPSRMSFAVFQYFLNGGQTAVIVRQFREDPAAPGGVARAVLGGLELLAADPGQWGDELSARSDLEVDGDLPGAELRFNLRVEHSGTGAREEHRNVSLDPDDFRYVRLVLQQQSRLVRVGEGDGAVPGTPPDVADLIPFANGSDGVPLVDADLTGEADAEGRGFRALVDTDIFNLLCLPPLARGTSVADATWAAAAAFCRERRAFLLIDPPTSFVRPDEGDADAVALLGQLGDSRRNAALYFPWLGFANALKRGLVEEFPPSGAVAGVIARTDATRGVWKAPAGQEAGIAGTVGPVPLVDEAGSGRLNPLGINVLRVLPLAGTVIWGARTGEGADRLASQWKYVPVRRTALFIEETLHRALQWVVFEPNDEPLWSQIRLNVGTFLHTLFRQGAFQGSSPRDAYLVKCDADTTTQADIDRGVVNILVGFAPLKPAEFVVVQLQQLAGQAQA